MSMRYPSIWFLICEDLRTQREGILSQGFWALFVYRLSHPRINTKRGWKRKVWAIANAIGAKWIEFSCGISISESAIIGRRLVIEHFGSIVIHGNTVIGNDCFIRQGVTLGNRRREAPEEAPILEDDVEVGAGAKVLGKVIIGKGATVGANAVVVHDVPRYAVVGGVPARLLRAGSS